MITDLAAVIALSSFLMVGISAIIFVIIETFAKWTGPKQPRTQELAYHPTKTKEETTRKDMGKKKEIDVEQLMLRERAIFIYENITNKSALDIIKKIKALDSINHKPIHIWINSRGGSCSAGFALINIFKTVESKIVTIINAEVCSMASHISIAGDVRLIVPNGVAMFHDMAGGIGGDYSLKVRDRAEYLEKYYQLLDKHMRKYTKLSEKELKQARTGELWLFAEDCVKKGVVDKIIK